MDDVTASWLMEIILRRPIDDCAAKEILLRLPTPAILHPHLKKTLFIRQLISDLAAAPIRISHRTLDSLEIIEEVDRSLGDPHPHPALSAAYCAVAAELTVAPLRTARSSEAEAEFLDVADRIWNARVPDMEQSEARGLVSEGLRTWGRKVEDALVCEAARWQLPSHDTRADAEKALREYLKVAVDAMGPPILELLAGAVCGGPAAGRSDRADLKGGSRDAAEAGSSTRVGTVDPDEAADATGTRVVLHVEEKGTLEGSQQAQTGSLKDGTLKPHQNITAEVPVGVEEIEKRMAEAAAGPDDSGDVADMDVAGSSVNRMAEAPTDPIDPGHDQEQAHADMAGPSVEKDVETTSMKGHGVEDQGAERVKVPRTSLMERNPTARTCQWDDDSIETPSEKSAGSPKRPHLSTPRVQRISPLKLYENTKNVIRRKNKRWTPQEEDALREAVQKHGVGNWKCILKSCPEAFDDRTEVDLKDKWRNMSRYKL